MAGASFRELVADAVNSEEVFRISRIGLELAPHVLDGCVDGTVERFDFDAANGIEQLRAREHAARLARERGDELELGGGQIDRARADARLHAPLVERDLARPNDI